MIHTCHVVQNIRASSIPVEIAAALDARNDVTADIVSHTEPPSTLPDIVTADQVRSDMSPVSNYSHLLNMLAADYDIVHTQHISPAGRVGWHARGHNIMHINTQQGHLHYSFLELLKNIPSLALADAIIFNSKATADSYCLPERALMTGTPTAVIPNGINVTRIEPYHANIDTVEEVVTACRLVKRKNIDTLIQAIARVDEVSLTIVGDGPRREHIEAVAAEYDITERVHVTGFVDREEVWEYLAGGEVFALPSYGEGFGVAIAEAMGVGLPVITSDQPTMREVVGDAGVFVNPDDVADLADALRILRDNPSKARQRGQTLRNRVFTRYNLRDCAASYRDFYEHVLPEQ